MTTSYAQMNHTKKNIIYTSSSIPLSLSLATCLALPLMADFNDRNYGGNVGDCIPLYFYANSYECFPNGALGAGGVLDASNQGYIGAFAKDASTMPINIYIQRPTWWVNDYLKTNKGVGGIVTSSDTQLKQPVHFSTANLHKQGNQSFSLELGDRSSIDTINLLEFSNNHVNLNIWGTVKHLNITDKAKQANVKYWTKQDNLTLETLTIAHEGTLDFANTMTNGNKQPRSINHIIMKKSSNNTSVQVNAKNVSKITFSGIGGTLNLLNKASGTANTTNSNGTYTLILSNTPITLESGTHTLNARGTINNLTFSGTGGTLTLNNGLSISNASATVSSGNHTLNARGTINNLTFSGTGGTLTLNNGLSISNASATVSSGTHTLNAGGTINNLTFSGTGGTLTLNNGLSISNASATVSSGTHTLNANNNNDIIKTLTFQGQGGSLNLANGPKVEAVSITSGTSIMQASDIKGTMPTFNQTGGSFTLISNKPVTSYTQSGGSASIAANVTNYTLGTSSSASQATSQSRIASLALSNTTAHLENHGTITTLSANSNAQQTITNIGNITTFTIQNGPHTDITNYGTINNLTANNSTYTQITNEGNITNLTHKGAGMFIKQADRFANIGNVTQEGVGDLEFDKLISVGQSGMVSSLSIKSSGNIMVNTLYSGLRGNTAERVVKVSGNSNTTASTNGTSGESSQGKLIVRVIEITSLDGDFNPYNKISHELKDYATEDSASQLSSIVPEIRASRALQLAGINFCQGGEVCIDASKSVAGTLSSIIITQSMRRKLLSDIYLSEQTRRSLKGSEKENLARERAALLASPAVAKYQKDKAQYDKELQAWHAKANTPENKKLIADYQKAKASYDKQKEAYDKLSNKAKKKAKAPKEPTKPDIIAKAPKEPKEPLNYRSAKEQYEKDLQAWYAKANTPENKKLIADYEKAKANYEKAKADYNKLSANAKKKAKAPQEPREPAILTQRPDYIPSPQEYQRAKKQYDLDIKEWNKLAHTPANRKIIAAYEKAKKKYDKDLAKYQEWEQSGKNGKAPKAPTKPIEPDILTKKPTLPISPNLDPDVVASLEAGVNDVVGDFFIRAIGSEGDYNLENGTQTNSYSAGAMLGGNKLIRIGNGYASLGFYGGYEYTKNGYKDSTAFTIDSNMGFAGVRFSHLFAQSKLAGLYYILGADGGYGRANTNFIFTEEMAYRSGVNLYSYGTSLRLGSAIYLNGLKSMLLPGIGVGLEGGILGAFAMQAYGINGHATPMKPLRFGSNGENYNLGYGQANLNYYQELGDYFSVTFGGGARYLINRAIEIGATIQNASYKSTLYLNPLYYYGTATLSLYTDGLGDFSAGYTYIQGGTGMTHNASLRYHYFF